MAPNRVLNIAHRGASAYEPENTLRAVRKALELNADMVEIDVRLSKDGRVMVIHDETVDRTTDGRGYVRDMTLEELRGLDAGKGERIPTLEEVMGLVKGRAGLLIDVKDPPPIEREIVRITEGYGMEGDVIIIVYAFPRHTAVKRVKELNPGIRTDALFTAPPVNLRLALELGVDVLHVGGYRLATRDLVEEAHRHGLLVIVGTTDGMTELRGLIEMGVDGITVDDPVALYRAMRQPL
ncbi:TPA: glycerophosphodiester phosphodiesterase [Candidatus Bathyarchaeota archaeon]|nr:glycerophosphodiester phosphodiesterase [Candidatus Bathyarchaeota archaeon]